MVRNTLKYANCKDMKSFARDLKTIYMRQMKKTAYENMQEVTEKWNSKYPNSMKRWEDNWDAVTLIFKFSQDVRNVIYTTNAIESLNKHIQRS